MVVAALQAINGINLFGAKGGPSSVIHVLPDEMTRNYTTLHSALPRESNSKEVDAAVLSVISYPAFAVSDIRLANKTRNEIVKKLGGRFGDDAQQVEDYQRLLEPLLVDANSITRFGHSDHSANSDHSGRISTTAKRNKSLPGTKLVPELYIVPKDLVNKEKQNPGSVDRFPNENLPLVWAQSLYIMGSLLKDNLLSVAELDPLGRRQALKNGKLGTDVVLQLNAPEDWHHILQGDTCKADSTRRLQFNDNETQTNPSKPRSVRRKSSGDLARPQSSTSATPRSPLKTPMGGHSNGPEKVEPVSYKLKDHVDGEDFTGTPVQINPLANLAAEDKENIIGSPRSRSRSPMRGLSANRLGRNSFSYASKSTDALIRSEGDLQKSFLSVEVMDTLGNQGEVSVELGSDGGNLNTPKASESPDRENISPMTISTEAPTPANGATTHGAMAEVLTLSLGDHVNIGPAIELLKSSANLFDQIDLLHYLYSCLGLEHSIDGLGKVSALLEEVYAKARELKLWSIVRQAAGLLKKTPVTVGYGDNEVCISEPKSPEDLAAVLFGHCVSDVPMREEISRLRGCEEEEAIELLMELSPSEMKSLLQAILSPPNENSAAQAIGIGLSTLSKLRGIQIFGCGPSVNATETARKGDIIAAQGLPSTLTLSLQSAGFSAGNYAKVELIRDGKPVELSASYGRGLNVFLIDSLDGSIVETASFDTHVSADESAEFVKFIEWTEPGMIVAIVLKDDGGEHLTEAARETCESLGSTRIREVGYRDSWCLISEKGDRGSVIEAYSPAAHGPTQMITRTIDLVSRRSKVLASLPSHSSSARLFSGTSPALSLLPSGGHWLRKRRNDGALNRVPQEFYPKVWHILSKCKGILVGNEYLPRDPTCSEKTPEEFNFAIQIESLLDSIRDPAERQLAIECLVVISRISERNPEIHLAQNSVVDLLQILRDATQRFWTKWVREHNPESSVLSDALAELRLNPEGSTSHSHLPSLPPLPGHHNHLYNHGDGIGRKSRTLTPSASNNNLAFGATNHDLTFEKNEKLAKRLFFDLHPDGKDGSMTFLAESCVRTCFDIRWVGTEAESAQDEAVFSHRIGEEAITYTV
ncbi:hypothetical protein HDU96_004369 [Phlyctochytrium bullatum]|nr:hypothetical protein HDU96_004369 [Phlyctochytrium bullatum]